MAAPDAGSPKFQVKSVVELQFGELDAKVLLFTKLMGTLIQPDVLLGTKDAIGLVNILILLIEAFVESHELIAVTDTSN